MSHITGYAPFSAIGTATPDLYLLVDWPMKSLTNAGGSEPASRAQLQAKTERMARRISEDPESLTATGKGHGTKREGLLLGFIQVVYSDVEMHLLRRVGVRPARRPKLGRQLEREARPVGRVTDDNPVVVVLYPDEAEEFLVERRETTRVGSVDNKAAPLAGHEGSMASLAAQS